VDCCPVNVVSFFGSSSGRSKNPLSWPNHAASSIAVGEAETSSAGEHLVKE